jgi:hypothetical protein
MFRSCLLVLLAGVTPEALAAHAAAQPCRAICSPAVHEVPKGERVFLDDVHNTSLIVGLSVPLAPLVPKP